MINCLFFRTENNLEQYKRGKNSKISRRSPSKRPPKLYFSKQESFSQEKFNIQSLDEAKHDIENDSDRVVVICLGEAGAANND